MAVPVGKLRPRLVHRAEPDIAWTYAPRIEPGQYRAYCRLSKRYFDKQFKRWVCAVQFDVLDNSLAEVLSDLTWYLNLGSGKSPRAGRRSRYWAAWIKANGGAPKRGDRLSPRIFEGRFTTVVVEDTTKNHLQEAVDLVGAYSVIRDVVQWETGGKKR